MRRALAAEASSTSIVENATDVVRVLRFDVGELSAAKKPRPPLAIDVLDWKRCQGGKGPQNHVFRS